MYLSQKTKEKKDRTPIQSTNPNKQKSKSINI